MSIFTDILARLGLKKSPAKAVTPVKSNPPSPVKSKGAPLFGHPVAMPMVDVMTRLENMAKSKPGLDWRVSIVDLLKLLGIDSSYDARKQLATELGCPANLMNDSASMNTWLHKTVLQKIAENGGNIPQSLL